MSSKELIRLCDRLVFEFDHQLRDYEIKAFKAQKLVDEGKS